MTSLRPTPVLLAILFALAAFFLRDTVTGTFKKREIDNESRCRCFPGDSCWPTATEWDEFNQTLGGKLIATIPIASVCHDNQAFTPYDAEACGRLQSVWEVPETHLVSPSSPMAPFYANMSCDPFTPREAQCIIGTYVRYSVNASSARDYQLTLAFARRNNIRLVIRNTGHDYLSKSTGAGAIALWTHHIRDISIFDYESPYYRGKAMKVGAGVMNFEAQEAAHAQGLLVVGGFCPTVGVAGGYTQGGGHGTLASKYGLGADQVLEWEVVTADGLQLTASPAVNADMYWALSGGGGGTYGAVLSMTVKTYPETKVAAAKLSFTSQGVSSETFYDVVQTILLDLPKTNDAGIGSLWILAEGFFMMQPIMAPDLTSDQLAALLQPSLDALDKSGITYDYAIRDFPTYFDAFEGMNPPYNITQFHISGRFVPRSLISSETAIAPLMDSFRFILSNGGVMSGMSLNVSRTPVAPNSVHPAWRTSAFVAVYGTPYHKLDYEANIKGLELLTNVLGPSLEKITPGGGTYLNEGNIYESNFQEVFYGASYDRLKSIKERYDPNDLFYGPTAVGSEEWQVESDGRLCRA
ncbi:FAD binding domain-containing protein [Hypoxylon sp. FL0543]|nr:FAD binding domain-containing protein [Hypoxylon sp. FL0543]